MKRGQAAAGILLGILILVGFIGLGWVFMANDLAIYRFFGIRYENTRRQIFEQSKAYNQGMIQELQNMQFAYYKADADGKKALAPIILHRAADFNLDQDQVPQDLRAFIDGLRQQEVKQ